MKKQIIFIAMLAFAFIFSQNTQAQQGEFKINPGLELGIPMGDFSDLSSFGFGVTAKALYNVSEDGQVEFTLGYISFPGKKIGDGIKFNTSVIPIMAGYRHNFDGIYGEIQLGLASVNQKAKVSVPGYGSVSGSDSTTEFSWAIGAGYMFEDFDISLRYQAIQASGGSLGWIGLRFGYNFDI